MNGPPFDLAWIRPVAAATAGAVGFVLVLRAGSALRGTTLVAPAMWAAGAVFMVAATECMAAFVGASPSLEYLRMASALLTLAPVVAVLGARRPHDGAWQWIVLSLIAVLALPLARSLAAGYVHPAQPHAAWGWFLGALLAAGPLNYLPTRFCASSMLLSLGQACLLARQLPLRGDIDAFPLTGLLLIVSAIVLARFAPGYRAARAGDRLWLDFRDMFGALWGLRIAERFNSAAAAYRWNVRLGWRGYYHVASEGAPESAAADPVLESQLHQVWQGLLWRFVPSDWVDRSALHAQIRKSG